MARPSPSHAGKKELVAVGEAIRRRRLALALSQEALSHLSGIDRSYMGGIERGEHNLALVNLVRICGTLQVSPSALLAGAGLWDKGRAPRVTRPDCHCVASRPATASSPKSAPGSSPGTQAADLYVLGRTGRLLPGLRCAPGAVKQQSWATLPNQQPTCSWLSPLRYSQRLRSTGGATDHRESATLRPCPPIAQGRGWA